MPPPVTQPVAEPAPAQTTPAPATPTDMTASPAIALGFDPEDGSFLARFGGHDFRVSAEQLAAPDTALAQLRLPVPGLTLNRLAYSTRQRQLTLTAGIAIPALAEGEITVRVNNAGRVTASGTMTRDFAAPGLGRAQVTLAMSEDGVMSGRGSVQASQITPRNLRGVEASGAAELTFSDGVFSGSGRMTMTYAELGSGTVDVSFGRNGFSASGQITISPPFLNQISADIASDEAGNIIANAQIEVGQQTSPLPNLTLSAGTITLGYNNGAVTFSIAHFGAGYAGLGNITIESLTLDRNGLPTGNGSFTGEVPFLSDLSGSVAVARGRVSGQLTIAADQMPEALPITGGSVTARLGEEGGLTLSGTMQADFGPAGNADIAASYGPEGFDISGTANLTIPGLNPVTLTAQVQNGDLSGAVEVPVDTALLPGLTGSVTVTYEQGRWGGETTLNYSADDGRLSGTVTVRISQNAEGGIDLGGEGSVTAQLMPGLQGTLTATILPEGGVDVSGEILVTEPYELFPEMREDRELFRYAQSIPLWAILVAIIRVRAGVRAGIGPGVFRNIRVTGSFTIGSDDADPSFSVSGELYIPAFVEGYVAFGAGLGLDVVLGSLTGGIEGVATAGIYGAISVVPTLSYADGDWSINGLATLAAGARLKVGLNAWAEVEAFWVTVWERTWNLAEHTMSIGPDLGLQAEMNYTFGHPEPPTLEFRSSDIDTESLIQDAMPEDGPAGSGAREALQNRAEWRGALQEQRDAPVPAEHVAQANAAETPPAPPAPPSGGTPGGTNAAGGAAPTPAPDPAADPAAQSQAVDAAATPDPTAAGTVPDNEMPETDQPRYPNGISLAMLDEPPVPAERTVSQQQEDLTTARRVLEMASAQASNSDTLDDYFPRVKNRFRLTSLGYEGDFQTGFKVKGKINPEFELTVHEPLSGRGIPGSDRATQIIHTSSELGGDTVGMSMTAMPLGPDHRGGSGPSGQTTLFSKLPTGWEFSREAHANFIKGHLLNDHLGGEGVPRNLFPITAYANSQHSRGIEESVKQWVNTDRLWVRYEVNIAVLSYELDASVSDNYVHATLTARASVLDTTLQPVSGLTRAVTIDSNYTGRVDIVENATEDPAVLAAHAAASRTARPEDHVIDIMGTNRTGGTTEAPRFPDAMLLTLKQNVRRDGYAAVDARLRGYAGFGPGLSASLQIAYWMANRLGNVPLNNLSPGDRTNLRRIITMWDAGLSGQL